MVNVSNKVKELTDAINECNRILSNIRRMNRAGLTVDDRVIDACLIRKDELVNELNACTCNGGW